MSNRIMISVNTWMVDWGPFETDLFPSCALVQTQKNLGSYESLDMMIMTMIIMTMATMMMMIKAEM